MTGLPFIIGLTGGLASGKSTVLHFFQKLGIDTFSADTVVHHLIAPSGIAYPDILEHFGSTILTANQDIDRSKLRTIIFNNPMEKAWLEALLHPLVRKLLFEQASQAESSYVIVEIPLLAETNTPYEWIDRILVVDTDEAEQQKRAKQRSGLTESQSRAIIDQQAPRQKRLQIADDVLHNNDLSLLELNVKQLHNKYLSLALKR